MAEIVLINPRFETSYWGLEHSLSFLGGKAFLPTASLPLLAALTPAPHNVTLIDENVEPIDFDLCERADVVGLTGMFVQRTRMREILTELKRRQVFTVVGGPWITVQEGDFGELADAVFIGEAEETWPRFLADWLAGSPQARYEQSERTDLSTLPVPRYDLMRMDQYRFGSIQMTRGCPFMCEFCDIIVVFGRQPRIRTAAQVVAELDALLALKKEFVFVVDDNMIGNKKAIKPVLREVIAWQQRHGYPIAFGVEASIDLAEDDELMHLMAEANVTAVFVGIETPDEAALRETRKVQNLADRRGTLLDKVHRIQSAGMEVWSGMIVGFDSDDDGVFGRQHRFIHEAHIVNTMVNMLVAIPRTPLYARLEREGRLDHSDEASRRGSNVVPRQMSAAELHAGCAELMTGLYEPANYFSRLDELYLKRGLRPGMARSRYLRRHPLRWLSTNGRVLGEALFIIARLLRRVPEPALRREYLRRFARASVLRRGPAMLHVYALKCALHYHSYMMAADMMSARAVPRAATASLPERSAVAAE